MSNKTQVEIDAEFNSWFKKSFDALFKAAIKPVLREVADTIVTEFNRIVEVNNRNVEKLETFKSQISELQTRQAEVERFSQVVNTIDEILTTQH